MKFDALESQVNAFWESQILPTLQEYVRIPNESPAFDKEWAVHGHMDRAVKLVADWILAQGLSGASVRVLREGARTPLILVEVPGSLPRTLLMYGHLDKQPPFAGWREGLGPWQPVLDAQGRLYGRGAADDGYSAFAAVATLKALQAQGLPHGRVILLIEASEESGSPDLPYYLNAQAERIGQPGLVICLDSGCANYEQLWSSTSLRGMVTGTVQVEVLTEGVHSGMAGGIVPSALQVLRVVLNRLENPETGEILPAALRVAIPEERLAQARKAAQVLGGSIAGDFPWSPGVRPLADDLVQLLLNNTWRASLAVTGQDGMPAVAQAGNVLLGGLTCKFTLRTPPTAQPQAAAAAVKQALEADPPFGAKVTVSCGGSPGWDAPPLAPWLAQATDEASRQFYGREACYLGVGGSIPFMHMMGEKFPRAQFLITGVLGPHSNAHGPNEFLHVPYAKKLTCCLAHVVARHGQQSGG